MELLTITRSAKDNQIVSFVVVDNEIETEFIRFDKFGSFVAHNGVENIHMGYLMTLPIRTDEKIDLDEMTEVSDTSWDFLAVINDHFGTEYEPKYFRRA
jgi:hypothetical protein